MTCTKKAFVVAALFASSLVASAQAQTTVLYNGALGTSPTAQGLTYGSFPFSNFYTVGPTSTTLDTSAANATYAGFGTNAVALPHGNFTLRFDMRVISSDFTNPDRSGFDIIAIDNTGKGIELAFHANEVISLGAPDLFARVDQVSFDTTGSIRRYDLSFFGNTYALSANGTQILSGAIRDYSAATIPPPLPNPYATLNNLFLGDDTTSARGATEFSFVSVTVPEPSLMLASLVAMSLRRRTRAV